MPLPEQVDRQFLLQVLLARESLGSTALGEWHCGAARPQSDRDAHPAAHGHALLPRAGDRVRGARWPAGPHALYDCQPDNQGAPSSAGSTGLCVAAAGVCRGDRQARIARRGPCRQPACRSEHSPAAIALLESLSPMVWFVTALAILLAGGLLSLAVGKSPKAACRIGAASALLGGGMVLVDSLRVLVSGHFQSLRMAWSFPLVRPTWSSTRFPQSSLRRWRW